MAYLNGRPMDYIHFRWRRTQRQRGNADTRESNKKDEVVKHTHCFTGSEENYSHLEKLESFSIVWGSRVFSTFTYMAQSSKS